MSTSNTTNASTTSPSYSPLEIAIDKAYICMGAMAILANCLVFIVLASDRKLLKKSAFIFSITLSHLLGSCHMCFSGSFRRANEKYLLNMVNPWICVAQVWTMFYGLEFQTMGFLLAIAGIERLLAVATPNWFRTNWTQKTSWAMSTWAFLVGLCGVAWGLYNTSHVILAPLKCQIGNVYGDKYVAYFAAVSSFGGIIATVATVLGWLRGKKRFSKMVSTSQEGKKMLKQIRLTRTMLTIAALDFCLTVPPNFVLFLSKVLPYVPFSQYIPYYSNIAYSVNGVANLVAYTAVNAEFKQAAIALLAKLGMRSNKVTAVDGNGHGGSVLVSGASGRK